MFALSQAQGHPGLDRAPRRMGRRLALILATVAVVALVAIFVLRCKDGRNQPIQDEPLAAEQDSKPGQGPGEAEKAAPASTLHVMRVGTGVASVAFSADGNAGLVGGADQTFQVWNLDTGREKKTARKTFRLLEQLVFAPNGSRFAGTVMQNIEVFDADTGKRLLSLSSGSPHTGPKAFAATGLRVILSKTATFGDPFVLVWDLESGKTFRINGSKEAIRCVALSPDGKLALFAGNDGVRIAEVESGKEVCRLDRPAVVSAAFAPDGKEVLTGEALGSLILWDTATGRNLRRFDGHVKEVTCVLFSADGQHVVSGSADRTVRVWNTLNAKEQQRYAGHEDTVTCIALTSDGERILSGSTDQTMRLWKVEKAGR